MRWSQPLEVDGPAALLSREVDGPDALLSRDVDGVADAGACDDCSGLVFSRAVSRETEFGRC